MNKFYYITKYSLILIFLNTFLLFGIVLYTLWKYSPELPSYDKIKNYKPNLSSRIYTSDGLLIEKFYIQERIFVPINRIPQQLINAFLATLQLIY